TQTSTTVSTNKSFRRYKSRSIQKLYTTLLTEQQSIFKELKLLTLKIDKKIANYLGYENPEFITVI
ncbi:42490_t:CDS:1, partial [Gigaspora margarita]